MGKFVHLHGHTEYSLLDGLAKISKLVKHVKASGMDAIAITDHGVMYGAIDFYKACKKEEIKPIIGCEFYVAPRGHRNKEGKADTEPYHLTVMAKNLQGYRNLMRLTSIAHIDGFYYKPRIDKELLKQYSEGLICLSGCPAGEFIRSLEKEDLKLSEEILNQYRSIFGEENFFLELQGHPYKKYADLAQEQNIKMDLERMQRQQDRSWAAARELSKKMGIPIVGTADFHYITKDDAEAQDALLCVQTGRLLTETNRLRMIDAPDYFVKTPEEMAVDFQDLPEALETSVKIADMVDVEIEIGVSHFPIFQTPDNRSSMDYLKELTYQGAKEKLPDTQEVKDRIEYELDVIEFKNYADYFLVVSDFIHWAHSQGIHTNTRGSAAGSIVLYCLGVTNLNPLEYQLPFERFLTKFRPSLPDIDADLADDRRDDVIHYVMDKYGHDRVAHIITYGTMQGRAAVRDIGRVMGLPYGDVDRIAKFIPAPTQGFHKPLKDAVKEVPELTTVYNNDPAVKRLLDLAMKIEGAVRHASVHAAGIVIAPDEMNNYTPLQKESSGDKVVAQYDMFAVEDAGLVKMDFLGIRNLSILGRAVDYVRENQGVEIDIYKIPLDDPKSFEILARGETMGLFQLSSDGMTKNLVELHPTSISDLAAMVALYRPGPLHVIPEYIARKRDPSLIKYYDPRMEEYMKLSLGLMVYQDDVLLTAINIAGYSWQDADKFRKAMGKKIPAEMAKQKDKFIHGAIEKGLSEERAKELFDLIAPFASYGFNKAHAASYAMVAYQTAYMKANYPVEFMAAVMTAEYGDTEKLAEAIEECKKMGIPVFPPDVNYSGVGFTIETLDKLPRSEQVRALNAAKDKTITQGIRFGMAGIKNVGVGAVESLIAVRQEKPFQNLRDICLRGDSKSVNKKTLESLIKAGAMDTFGTRASQLLVLEQCLDEAHKKAKMAMGGQTSLFAEIEVEDGPIKIDLPDIPEIPMEEMLLQEKELLGFYLHEPQFMRDLRKLRESMGSRISALADNQVGQRVAIGGLIQETKKVLTKRDGSEMAFVRLFDGTGSLECVVFPKTFAKTKYDLQRETVVTIWGKLDKREDQFSLLVDSVEKFDPEAVSRATSMINSMDFKSVEIALPTGADKDILKQISTTLKQFPGNAPISLVIPTGNTLRKMDLAITVRPNQTLINDIELLLGTGSIRLI